MALLPLRGQQPTLVCPLLRGKALLMPGGQHQTRDRKHWQLIARTLPLTPPTLGTFFALRPQADRRVAIQADLELCCLSLNPTSTAARHWVPPAPGFETVHGGGKLPGGSRHRA